MVNELLGMITVKGAEIYGFQGGTAHIRRLSLAKAGHKMMNIKEKFN